MAKYASKKKVAGAIGKGLTKSVLRRLRAQGLSVGQIAEKYGTTRMTIYRRFNDTVKGTLNSYRKASKK